jgi:hypothetical protein
VHLHGGILAPELAGGDRPSPHHTIIF